MIPLSYNTNGLRLLSLPAAIEAVAKAGYEGVELSMHAAHLHPLRATNGELAEIRKLLAGVGLNAVCLATGAGDLLSDEPFEPSLITTEPAAREMRVELIVKSLEIAQYLDIPVINLASGILKDGPTRDAAWEILVSGIRQCLKYAKDTALAIEPEPGMMIETTTQALALMEAVGDPRFTLNLDVGHVQCSEEPFSPALARAIPYARHTHVEDIRGKIHHHEIPGDGDLDFPAILKLFKDLGYAHYLSVELYHHAAVWPEALARSREYLLQAMPPGG